LCDRGQTTFKLFAAVGLNAANRTGNLEKPMRHLLLVSLVLAAGPSHAKVLAVALSSDGARVVLHDEAGPCVGEARLAEHISPSGDKVQGCWLATPGMVNVSFLDGERGSIPVAHLQRPTQI
jgi:hypothetical protein